MPEPGRKPEPEPERPQEQRQERQPDPEQPQERRPETVTEAGAGVVTEAGADPDAGLEPAAPAPLGVERPPTGHPAVDALLGRLADADHLPADGHLEVYEDVHRGLRHELTALDTARPGPTPTTQYDHRS